MERAFDTFQNQLTFAADCERSDYFPDRFICPCCEETLIFAAGIVQAAHFKHRASAPDCENRIDGMSRGPFADIESEPRDATLVALFTSKNRETTCSFVLRYRPGCDIDSIDVLMGQYRLPYQLHGRPEIDIPVSAAVESFFISALAGGQVMFRRVTKAFTVKPVLFRHSSAQSVRLPEHRPLHPGKYIACFPHDAPIQFPLVCEPKEMRCSLDIKVVSFTIPDQLNMRVFSFCRDSLGVTVKIQPFNYAILEPLALTEETPDTWTTSAEGDVAIVVDSKIRTGAETTLTVQIRNNARFSTETEPVTFGEKPHLLRISIGKQQPLIRIGIGVPPQFITELRYSETLREPATTRFRCNFRDEETGKTLLLCRSSWRLPEKLVAVREGKAVVESIEHPQNLKIEAANSIRRIAIVGESAGELLTEFLRESNDAVRIDAQGYPSILVPPKTARRRKAKTVDQHHTNKPPIRSRRRQAAAFRLGVGSRYSALAQ